MSNFVCSKCWYCVDVFYYFGIVFFKFLVFVNVELRGGFMNLGWCLFYDLVGVK